MDLTQLQDDLQTWRTHNFPGADATQQLLGVVEEVGELAHARLKKIQGIRGTEQEHQEAERDAVGDILIYLLGFCSYRSFNLEQILEDTATHVMDRDWHAYPKNGYTE